MPIEAENEEEAEQESWRLLKAEFPDLEFRDYVVYPHPDILAKIIDGMDFAYGKPGMADFVREGCVLMGMDDETSAIETIVEMLDDWANALSPTTEQLAEHIMRSLWNWKRRQT
jgi:hypothetical protein